MRKRSRPSRRHHQRRGERAGFTLIELMVSMALGFILLAGAFEMHAAFSRQSVHQQEIADMQQALRVGAQVIGRGVRTAGAGLGGGVLDLYDANTVPQAWSIGAMQFSNSNAFPNGYPATVWDKVANDIEAADPDWLRIVAFDATPKATGAASAAPGCVASGGCATVVAVNAAAAAPIVDATAHTVAVTDTRPFAVNSFFFAYNGDFTSNLTAHRTCVRQVTSIANIKADNSGTLVFDNTSPYNPPPIDQCMKQLATNVGPGNVSYVFAFDRSVIFRIAPATVAAGATKPPQLQAWYASAPGAIPNFYPEAQPNFQPLTDNIEDLQIALVMNNGTVCGTIGNSIDDGTPGAPGGSCQPQNVRALRFTLVARSSSPIPGWTRAAGENFPAIEDEAPIPSDGYLRRTLTEEMQIRNIPWGGP